MVDLNVIFIKDFLISNIIYSLLFIIIKRNGFPYNPFLNKLFITLEIYNINFLGVGLFGLFSIYLIWCVIKGNTSRKINIPFILSIHPMRYK